MEVLAFTVINKEIECDIKQVVGDNDYQASFMLDDEWSDKEVICRVVWNNRTSLDIKLEDLSCVIPAYIMKRGEVSIGVYAEGDEQLTTEPWLLSVRKSIREKEFETAMPHKEIWNEINQKIKNVITSNDLDEKVVSSVNDAIEKSGFVKNDELSTEVSTQVNAYLAENNIISVKQLGAKGDGITNDTEAFKKAFSSSYANIFIPAGDYLITSDIDINSVDCVGEKGTRLVFDYTGSREFMIQNNGWYDTSMKTASFKNIDFYINSSTHTMSHIFGFTSFDKIIFENCNFSNNAEVNSGVWYIDCYSNCHNVSITNCNFDIETAGDDSNLNTCFSFREYFANRTSENLYINNCNFRKNGLDETIWIDTWKGTLKNITITNCKLEDFSEYSESFFYVASHGADETEFIENVFISNCVCIKEKLVANAVKLGDVSSVDRDICTNFIVDNCTFITNGGGTAGSLLMTCGIKKTDSPIIRNSKIISNSTANSYQYGFLMQGKFKSQNNYFYAEGSSSADACAVGGISESKSDTFNISTCNVFNIGSFKVKNADITCYRLCRAYNPSQHTINIQHCNIEAVSDLIYKISSTTDSKILLLNNEITLGTGKVVYDYNNTAENNTLICINNNFITESTLILDSLATAIVTNLNNTKNYELITTE